MREGVLTLQELDGTRAPWLHIDRIPATNEFSFVLLSDRTGGSRPGIFEQAVAITNLFRPDFAIQIGDTIEGRTTDPVELARQWDEFDGITSKLEVPLFRVPGNHDVTNEFMRDDWLRRFGALYYHFTYHDVLFVILNTSDPYRPMQEARTAELLSDLLGLDAGTPLDELYGVYSGLKATDPDTYEWVKQSLLSQVNWEGTMPVNFSEDQLSWAERVIEEHSEVRWTFLCMHHPAWQGTGNPGLNRIRIALGARPYTAFAGHVHNYARTVIKGRDYIRLGNTGGTWVLPGDKGNFDHIALITVKPGETPRVANILLNGVRDIDGQPLDKLAKEMGYRPTE